MFLSLSALSVVYLRSFDSGTRYKVLGSFTTFSIDQSKLIRFLLWSAAPQLNRSSQSWQQWITSSCFLVSLLTVNPLTIFMGTLRCSMKLWDPFSSVSISSLVMTRIRSCWKPYRLNFWISQLQKTSCQSPMSCLTCSDYSKRLSVSYLGIESKLCIGSLIFNFTIDIPQ